MEQAGPRLANLIVHISANAALLKRGVKDIGKAIQPPRRSPKKRKPKRQSK